MHPFLEDGKKKSVIIYSAYYDLLSLIEQKKRNSEECGFNAVPCLKLSSFKKEAKAK